MQSYKRQVVNMQISHAKYIKLIASDEILGDCSNDQHGQTTPLCLYDPANGHYVGIQGVKFTGFLTLAIQDAWLMAYIGVDPNLGDITFQRFTGTGSATAFTLAQSVVSGEAMLVTIGNVVQEPGPAKHIRRRGIP